MQQDVIIIGGGIAGLQAAIQLGRYMHAVTVVDSSYGRSVLCRRYQNLLGWPDGVSGLTLRKLGRQQAESLGVAFIDDEVVQLEKRDHGFVATLRNQHEYMEGSLVLLATGVMDRFVDLPSLKECLGITVFVCPDCDGYEVLERNTIVLGSGETGAQMALTLTYWTSEIIYVNDERKPVGATLMNELKKHGIELISEKINKVIVDTHGQFGGVELASGICIHADRAFIAYGGNEVRTCLASQLGAERYENGHIVTNPRTKMTSVTNLWAAGDIGVHSEMLPVAMAEGSLSAVWMHKALVQMGRRGVNEVRSI
jgi:thioredoxin reductase (NADPH)